MFDLGMSELLVIGIVALIVIGPRDLPGLFRSLGKFTAKMRAMAREFSRAMEAAADEAGVKDVAKDLKSATSAKSMGLDKVREAAERFEKWDPTKNVARPSNPTLSPSPAVAKAETPVAVAPDVAAPATPATPAATAAPEKPLGPATAALAEQRAARKAIAQEAAAALKKASAPPDPSPAAEPAKAVAPKASAPKAATPRKSSAKTKSAAESTPPKAKT